MHSWYAALVAQLESDASAYRDRSKTRQGYTSEFLLIMDENIRGILQAVKCNPIGLSVKDIAAERKSFLL